jgi:lambda family phage portal protein
MGALARLRGLLPSRPAPSAAYMRGEASPTFAGWHPALRSASDDVKVAWRLATARAVDMIQNSGWLAGAVEQSRAAVVGSGLTLIAKPDAAALGITQDQANELATRFERRYETWACNPWECDAGARYTIGQLGAHLYDHWQATGEGLATFPFFRRPGGQFGTKVNALPAWQLSDRTEWPRLIQGVRLDEMGAPVSYLLRRSIEYGVIFGTEMEVDARDMMGRPIVVHIFDGGPNQVRGITPFVSVLKVTRQFDQLADATLTKAIIQAIFAATLKSSALPEDVLEALQSGDEKSASSLNNVKGNWYQNVDINLGVRGKIANLFPGDELSFLASNAPGDTYEPFAKFLLRECSRAAAITYEEFTGDYAGATFSSMRMATTVIWPRVVYRRKAIPGRFHQLAYEAFLEEDIESGGTDFPGGIDGFLANKAAACRAEWRGPPRPQPDDFKTAKAYETLDSLAVISEETIASELGFDLDDVYEARARAMARRKQLGLPEKTVKADPAGDALANDDAPAAPAPARK